MQNIQITVVRFQIPTKDYFPEQYNGASIEVGVWPPIGLSPSVLDSEGALERLEDWTVDNIFHGLIDGSYSVDELVEERICVRVIGPEGDILLDTFDRLADQCKQQSNNSAKLSFVRIETELLIKPSSQ